MGKQVKKVCKHEPGQQWTDGCCSSNPQEDTSSRKPDERVVESAFEQSFSAQPAT
ncbi:hypothetical protein [Mastigocladopsis repens]|uniref:hypothetical protein n=1 Tax=Mastigocladopsis repens TaxID=221287 RepID=UPI00030E0FA6|nr:hypothetical protein [Mastigocladopsis repens]